MFTKKRFPYTAAKCLAVLLAFVLALSVYMPSQPVSAADSDAGRPYSEVFNKVSDADTSNSAVALSLPAADNPALSLSTRDNGRIWTDKTVSADRAVIYDANGNAVQTIDADEDEFLVTLSALSQSYTAKTLGEPTDTVFVIDISSSMFMNNLKAVETEAEKEIDANGNGSISRVEAMVNALNGAIDILMAGSPDNRFAVVAFGGSTTASGESRIAPILKLGHHVVDDGKYFTMRSGAYIKASSQLSDSAFLTTPANREIRVTGGTPTQRGIYAGAKLLIDEAAQIEKGTRKPNIVLLSDGGATLGWQDYKFELGESNTDTGSSNGNANKTDLGVDVLTVLTASYFKQRVHDAYYGADDTSRSAGFYTIGLGMASESGDDAPAVLDPEANARKVEYSHNGRLYNMQSVLDELISLPADVLFPALEKGGPSSSAREMIRVANGGNYIKSYDYTDGYYQADEPESLNEAFNSIAQQIASAGKYTTKVEEGMEDFDGYLIFSDVLGKYMEVKDVPGLWYGSRLYDGSNFANTVINTPAGRNAFIETMRYHQPDANGNPRDPQWAEALLDSCINAGELYYNSDGSFSNKITYYADEKRLWTHNYFNSDGSEAGPGDAAAKVDLYTFAGDVTNPLTGETENVMNIVVHVVTALKPGTFESTYSDGDDLIHNLSAGQQMVRWYIPASLVPQRVINELEEDGTVKGLLIGETAPTRFIYSVGLNGGLITADADGDGISDFNEDTEYKDLTEVSGKEDAYYFYTNDAMFDMYENYDNVPISYFLPSADNPYYYYTVDDQEDGFIRLYDYSHSLVTAAMYNANPGGPYYTKNEYSDAAVPGYTVTEYLSVGPQVVITEGADAPYIEPGQVKSTTTSGKPRGNDSPLSDDYNVFYGYTHLNYPQPLDLAGTIERAQVQYLGSNGRLEVPFASVSLTKEWDKFLNLDVENLLIKDEWAQLYADREYREPVGLPMPLNPPPLTDLPSPSDSDWNVASNAAISCDWDEWSGLPLYRFDAGADGAAELIEYTVAEGFIDPQTGDFVPYDSTNNPDFDVIYYQPAWNASEEEFHATIYNRSKHDYRWYIRLNKSFEGLDPYAAFPLGVDDAHSINFRLYLSVDGGSNYLADQPIGEVYYPRDFAARIDLGMVLNSGDSGGLMEWYEAYYGTSLEHLEIKFLVVEREHSVENYTWNGAAKEGFVKGGDIDGPTDLDRDGEDDDIPGRDIDRDGIIEIGENDWVYLVDSDNEAGDPVYVATGGAFSKDYDVNFTNSYIPDYPTLKLTKEYEGSITIDDTHDITFVIEGFATEQDRTNNVNRIFYDTTHCHYIKAGMNRVYEDNTGDDGTVLFPIEGQPDGIDHPDFLPVGYYRITEYGADAATKAGDPLERPYGAALNASGSLVSGGAISVTTSNDPEKKAEFYLGYGDDASIVMTNDYTPRAVLRIVKRLDLTGLNAMRSPDDIAFKITGGPNGEYLRYVGYSEFDPETGDFIINDLLPGEEYTITEEGGSLAGHNMTVMAASNGVTPNEPNEITVTLPGGETITTVSFFNSYNLAADPDLASLTIEKIFKNLPDALRPNVVFTVTGTESGGAAYTLPPISYSDFTDGKYIINDLRPGTYTVKESGANVGGYELNVNHPEGYTVDLDYGETERIIFENTYTPLTPGGGGSTPPGTGTTPPGDGSTAPGHSMTVEKSLAEGQPSIVGAGSTVRYVITVTNTGELPLSNIKVTDEIGGNTYEVSVIENLAPGASREFPFEYTVPADAKPGTVIRNTAVADESNAGKKSEHEDVTVSMFVDEHIWYIRGYEDNTLRPNNTITRAEVSMAFYRLLKPELRAEISRAEFSDVTGKEWYGLGVDLLAHLDMVNGYEDGTFRPNRPITRSELAAVISRFDQLVEDAENPFSDLDPDDWAHSYILSATAKGWFVGDGNGTFRPYDNITRSEFVTAVNRVLNRHILLADIPSGRHKFDDFSNSHWAYAAFTESMYTHDFERKADGVNETWPKVIADGISAPYNQ